MSLRRERPYICAAQAGCEQIFAKYADLMKHEAGHFPHHKCNFPGCDFATLSGSSFKIHVNKHTGEQRYVCPDDCGYKTHSSSNLTRHRKAKHGYIPSARHPPRRRGRAAATLTSHNIPPPQPQPQLQPQFPPLSPPLSQTPLQPQPQLPLQPQTLPLRPQPQLPLQPQPQLPLQLQPQLPLQPQPQLPLQPQPQLPLQPQPQLPLQPQPQLPLQPQPQLLLAVRICVRLYTVQAHTGLAAAANGRPHAPVPIYPYPYDPMLFTGPANGYSAYPAPNGWNAGYPGYQYRRY